MKPLTLPFACLLLPIWGYAQAIHTDGIDPAGPFCSTEGLQALDGDPNGGTWGGAVDAQGIFDPSMGAVGSPYLVTYTWTNGGGQTESDTAYIVVNDPPVVAIDPAGPFCQNSGAQQLNASPAGGWWEADFGTVSQTGLFNPFFGPIFSPYAAWYTFTDTNGCTASDTTWITVRAIPVVNVLEVATFCLNDPADTLFAWPSGGTWTGAADSAGVFDPSNGPGLYQAVYTYTDTNGCSASAQSTITVLDQVQGQLSDPGPLCDTGAPTFIWATPFFGSYGGVADSLGFVHPMDLLPGDHVVTYTYQCSNCCPSVDSLTITVHGPPELTVLTDVICSELDSAYLVASPTGGIWSGSATSDGLVLPDMLGVGVFPIHYAYTDAFGCGAILSDSIAILPSPNMQWNAGASYCSGGSPDTLMALPIGGLWGGALDTAGVFVPSAAGTFLVTYAYQDSATCYAELSDSLVVHPTPVAVIQPAGPFCDNGDPDQLSASPSGGVWTQGADVTGLFDPSMSATGPVDVVYAYVSPQGCADQDTFTVNVIAVPEVSFGPNGPYCMNSGLRQLEAFPANGIWGGNALPDGEFNTQRPAGKYMISYRIDTVVCTVTGIDSVHVDDCTFITEFEVRDLDLYPNPADDRATIVLPANGSITSIRIIDHTGREVPTSYGPVGVGRMEISTQHLAEGAYTVLLQTRDGLYRSRVQIMH